MTNQELIDQARKLCKAATPGPYYVELEREMPAWFFSGLTKEQVARESIRKAQVIGPDGGRLCLKDGFSQANATLIAAAPTLLLQLAEALEDLEEEPCWNCMGEDA
jgi:hypothetical protein